MKDNRDAQQMRAKLTADIPATYRQLAANFADPPGTFRPVPWWAWTGDTDESEITRQLQEMRDKGIREYFLFSMSGLDVPYLETALWRKVRFALKESRRLYMKVWIYDEYNWPSGACAGRILEDHPEMRSHALTWLTRIVQPGRTVRMLLQEEIVAVQALVPGHSCKLVGDYTVMDGKFRVRRRSSASQYPSRALCIPIIS